MATELAKAYVQIIPSAEGIKGKIGQALGNDPAEAGKSAGSSLGKTLISTATKALAAAGIGKAISASITEGAALEQSIGGIETLFKDSADSVKAYATKAYKIAGLSANAYMETATGFAASLLQGLGGDTEKAAKITDMAITDMSDNANKMGTDMSSIQNAYQGFAKQNYTMLDNLKLGYGGTKSEMERLLKDAQKITGVKYDLDNLSDVYEAIHVIQGELDITGTTAKEAATTLSGSLASVKSAFTNVLGNLALGENVGPAMQELCDSAITFFNKNLVPMGLNIVKTLPKGIIYAARQVDWGGAARELVTVLQENLFQSSQDILGADDSIIQAVAGSIESKMPQVLDSGVELVSNLALGMLNNLPTVIEGGGKLISELLAVVMKNLPTILQAGVKLVGNLTQGLIDSIPSIILAMTKVIIQLVQTTGKHAPEFLQKGIELIGQLAAGLIRAVPDLLSKIPTIVSGIKKEFTNVDWKEIGSNIISGIKNGILSGAGAIADAAKEAASSALHAAKKILKIKSPSRVMRDEVGKWIPAGIAVGIRENSGSIGKAMEELAQETTGVFQSDLTMKVQQGQGMVTKSKLARSNGKQGRGGFTQNIYNYSPKELSPSETARQTRNATRNLVLALGV